jgi:hypothetical protein
MATVTFPNSYLSTASQPWGRIVEKQLVDLSLLVTSNEINNSARDKQLLASLNRTNATAISAQAAADTANAALADIGAVKTNIYVPGTTQINGTSIKTGTISADKITAGTLTGFTIQTSASGQRTELSGTNIKFYASTGSSPAGYIDGQNYGAGGFVEIVAADNHLISIGAGGIVLDTPGVGALTLDTSGVVIAGTVTAGVGGLIVSNPGGAAGSNYLQVPDTYVRNVQSGRIVYVASNGTYNSASSSERYKQDIEPYQIDMNKLMQLEPVSFRYKQAVNELGNDADTAHGFIAEQADTIGLNEFVDYELDERGNLRPDNFRYIDFIAALFAGIKQQQQTIINLNNRLEALENK